jgi:Condensation domain
VYAGGDIASQPLPAALGRSLRAWANTHRATPAAIWAAAFALHLARERKTHDVAFGVILSGRDGRSAETIGMLANCLPLRVQADPAASIEAFVTSVTRGLETLEQLAHTPLLALHAELSLDPRTFLDTLFISWGFPVDRAWQRPDAIQIRGGRGVTLTAPRTALIVSGTNELAVGARAFHRTDRIRREVLAIVDQIVELPSGTPLARLLELPAHEGGMSVAVPDL